MDLPKTEDTSERNVRRFGLKLGVVVIVAIVFVFVAESVVFHFIGGDGWVLAGPIPGHELYVEQWVERFGRLPAATDDGIALAPLTPPRDAAHEWYREDDAGNPAQFEGENGLIIYSIRAEPQIPHLSPIYYLLINSCDIWLPIMSGMAVISSEGDLWCRIIVRAPYSFRSREYVGSVDEFMPSPSAKGWHTTKIQPVLLAHNVAVLLLLFGWPFFIRDGRAAFLRLREIRAERSNRLPRHVSLRAVGLRMAVLVLAAAALVLAIDSVIFFGATRNGPSFVPSVVTSDDEAWWRSRVGTLPDETTMPIDAPPAFAGRQCTWWSAILLPQSGHGGGGVSGMSSSRFPKSLLAYDIQPHATSSEYWPLRGRVLASSDGCVGYRLGSPMPFVVRERIYLGMVDEPLPDLSDARWEVEFRPLGFLAAVAILVGLLGLPVYLRDGRAVVRIMRCRCTSCGYRLRGLPTPRCPECGCPVPTLQQRRTDARSEAS